MRLPKSSKLLCAGALVLSMSGAALGQALTNEQQSAVFQNWANNYGRTFASQQDQLAYFNTLNERNNFNMDYNLARTDPQAYINGLNYYSDRTNAQFANGHLGGNVGGLSYINGTDTKYYKTGGGIAHGTLAGIIVASVLGGLLVIAGFISSFLSWRSHMDRKHSTLYADYRNAYRAEKMDAVKDHVPGEFYRESHRIALNDGYVQENVASNRYREANHLSYIGRATDREVIIPKTNADLASNVIPHDGH
ncbi:hypothetical protein CYY_000096 [Polysphondylium violaceum]|uniref:Cathepsin propeptide inhibitor domain-containing protein n=1 Tax=Polysphondylium violaceum TaxID=133409 RepID=A0A8J4QBM0_9MYCE|nr:hypothetical protein CYY_000096 [Polysphondylium violaceum]